MLHFQSKLETFTKLKKKKKKKNSIGISVFGYENKENIQSMYQSNFF